MHDFSVNLFYTLSYPLNLCFTWSSIFVDSCIGTLLHQLRITAPFNTRAPQHWRRITGALFGMIGLKADLSLLYGRRCRRIPLLPSESRNAHKVVTVTESGNSACRPLQVRNDEYVIARVVDGRTSI